MNKERSKDLSREQGTGERDRIGLSVVEGLLELYIQADELGSEVMVVGEWVM